MMTAWAVLGGFVLDAIFGDPAWLPHPVVYMGKAISRLEKLPVSSSVRACSMSALENFLAVSTPQLVKTSSASWS